MSQDYKELIEYLDEKFTNTDQKFLDLDEDIKDMRLSMVAKEEFNDLQTSIDVYAKKADAYFQ